MSAIVRIAGRKAILCGGHWTSADPLLEARLNSATDAWIRETGGPAVSDADPERTTARQISVQFGGRIVRHARSLRRDARLHYLSRRQMEIAF